MKLIEQAIAMRFSLGLGAAVQFMVERGIPDELARIALVGEKRWTITEGHSPEET